MRAIQIHPKTNDLIWENVPDPFCGPDDVVLEVAACGVNRADLLQRRGLYPPPPGASEILGLEAAGVVSQVGSNVTGWLAGDRAMCLLSGGGYAERVRVHASALIPLPENMPWEIAAAIPEVFYTAYVNVFLEAGITAGETLLVHAGGSGVGTAAIQLAVEHGCTVIATASEAKLEPISELGAYAVDRNAEDFVACVHEVTQGRGADVILDPVGGSYLARNQACLAEEGRLVLIGLMGGGSAELNLATMLVKRQRLIGSVLRSRSIEEKSAITAHFLRDVMPLIVEEQVGPILEAEFGIEQAAEAHALLQSNETFGKVVLHVR
ncbi:MAG: NAD(P)H-quinone oxidoreductase [bacterium]